MKKRFNLPLILGIVLISISLGFLGFTLIQNRVEDESIQKVAAQIQALLPPITPGHLEDRSDNSMPALQLSGQDYLALLEVPGQDICLPVAAGWDANKLSAAPRHYYGSIYNNSLILGGSDRAGQFDFCSKIDIGQTITVTDMTGLRYTYLVKQIERHASIDAQVLTKKAPGLTLFVKDSSTFDYIVLRCQLSL